MITVIIIITAFIPFSVLLLIVFISKVVSLRVFGSFFFTICFQRQ